ncbi:MAG: zinc ribbon domain-containing protein [Anaerolineae bacterium]
MQGQQLDVMLYEAQGVVGEEGRISDKGGGDEGRQFCMMCGASNPDWARYCRGCGADLTGAVEPEGAVLEEAVVSIEEPPSWKSFLGWLFNPSFAIVVKIPVFGVQTVMAVWSLYFTGRNFLVLLVQDPLGIGCLLWLTFPLVFLPTMWYVQSMAMLYTAWFHQ